MFVGPQAVSSEPGTTVPPIYEERLSSTRTELVFVGLAALFLVIVVALVSASSAPIWPVAGACFFAYLLFCAFNYRVLRLGLTEEALTLRFGLVVWNVELSNVEGCSVDTTSLWRIGGAGLHFSPIRGRYRAMFNFLEFPRLLIRLREKKGLVRDIAFSTRHPVELQKLIAERLVGAA